MSRKPDLQAEAGKLRDAIRHHDYLYYVLARPGAYITEAEGHHYEETNSVGESSWPIMRGQLIDLLQWRP